MLRFSQSSAVVVWIVGCHGDRFQTEEDIVGGVPDLKETDEASPETRRGRSPADLHNPMDI